MKLYRSFKKINSLKNSVVSIGMFDGVHLGHASVINRVIAIAKEKNIKSIIITFSNSPVSYFSKDNIDLQITTSKEKIELFRKTQLDYLFVIEFNDYIANLIPSTFMNDILISLFKVSYMVFGYDNHFGKNREGTFKYITENFKDIKAELIIASKKDRITISSTRIKEEIVNGYIINANKLLGHPYDNNEKILPKNGVYYTVPIIKEKKYISITHIGIKPSVQESNCISIETHILDFNQSIYGQNITIVFIDRIRNEIKFNHINDLIDQITKDVSTVIKLNSLQVTT